MVIVTIYRLSLYLIPVSARAAICLQNCFTMTERTTRQSTRPESSSSPQNKETTKSIMDEIKRLKSEIIFKKELENVVQNIVKSVVSEILDIKMNVINDSMKENKQFLSFLTQLID